MRLSVLLFVAALALLALGVQARARPSGEGESLQHVTPARLAELRASRIARAIDSIPWHHSRFEGVERHEWMGALEPSQVKLSFVPQGMAVSFATLQPYQAPDAPTVFYGTQPNNLTLSSVGNESSTYGTSWFHTVVLPDLEPATQYFYRVAGSNTVRFFVSAPSEGDDSEFSLLLVGDMGLVNSADTMARMKEELSNVQWALHVGDLSYSDDFFLRPNSTYEGSWDQWQDLMEDITGQLPYMTLPGNHEVTCTEVTPFLCPQQQRNLTAYRHRVRMPWRESGGMQNLWFSYTYGPIHFVHISTETDFPSAPMGPGTFWNAGPFGDQLSWLTADLAEAAAAKQRGDIAWIVAAGHRPWKNSHKVCAPCQAAFENLFYKYGVDIYFAGHVHDYERAWPLAQNGSVTQHDYRNPQGIIHIVNGAAGNVEGHEKKATPAAYSAFLDEADFGYGKLTLANATALRWQFMRATDGSVVDDVWFTRNK